MRLAVLLMGLACLTLGLPGCEADRPAGLKMMKVEISDLPETVRKAAQDALPDVEFSGAWKNVDKEGSIHSYEIRGKNPKGKIREARVSSSGEILEME